MKIHAPPPSKRAFVYATLRADILACVRRPGQRLVIDDLASELGVSPIPVREALQQLSYEGLVHFEPYVGARVSEIHVELIEEVFALLAALEVLSSRAACVRMTDDDFAAMRTMLQRMDALVDDPEAWSQANVELHQFLAACAAMVLVPAMMSRALEHWQRFRRYFLEEVFARRITRAQQEHWQLLAALQTRDADHVESVIRTHNRTALAGYMDFLTRNNPFQTTSSALAGSTTETS